jgi:tRNA (guanine-N7-)-methyltransferase
LDKEIQNPRRKGAGSFFGRRHGKTLRPLHASLLETALPELRLNLDPPAPADIRDLFPSPVQNIRLEIGFGGGEHLIHRMRENAATGFIGVEPFVNGMGKLLAELHARPAQNIRVYDQDAALLLDWLPAASIDHIDILYPDPWPKKRQHKRRFVGPDNLPRLARVLKPGGKLCFASDIADYVNWTLIHVRAHGGFEFEARDADNWRLPYVNWPGTRYEAKALREERKPAYLSFKRLP